MTWMNVAGFLGKHWRGLIIVVLLVTIWGLRARGEHLHKDLIIARAALTDPETGKTWLDYKRDLSTCHGSLENLTGSVDRQNSAVEALKASGLQRDAAVAVAVQAAQKSASAATSAADRILKSKPAGADVCARLLDAERQVTEAERGR